MERVLIKVLTVIGDGFYLFFIYFVCVYEQGIGA